MAVTPDQVVEWLTSSTGVTSAPGPDDLLVKVLAAVEAHVGHYYVAPDPVTDDWELAIIMQTARLWGRRSSPMGIADVNDFGPVRISKLDSDVEVMLAPFTEFGAPGLAVG